MYHLKNFYINLERPASAEREFGEWAEDNPDVKIVKIMPHCTSEDAIYISIIYSDK